MNKKTLFVTFLTLGIVLSGCGKTKSNSSDTSTPSTSSSSTYVPDGHFDMWTNEQQELIKKYCGEVIPYPEGLIEGEVTVTVIMQYDDNWDEYYYLEIRNNSDTFTLENYYMFLEEFDWTSISDYQDEIVQTDTEGIKFVECTKASKDKTTGYDLLYMHLDESTDSEGNSVPAANVIRCYNDLCGNETTLTTWTEDELATIKYALTTDIPFIKLGSLNQVGLANANTLVLRDAYVNDLTSDYVDLLKEDGYKLDSKLSKDNGAYVLEKTLDDGAVIDALLYYFSGNYIYFYYTPKVNKYASWPTDIMNEIKEKSGVTVPAFQVAENGSYYAYKKNNTYYVYTYDLNSEFDYNEYALNQLQFMDLSWEETISFASTDLVDSNYQTVGFLITIELLTPTSTFVSTYPNDKVNEVITDLLGVTDVKLPEFTNFELPRSDKQVKYEVYGQEVYEAAYEYYYNDIKEYPFFYDDLPDEPSDDDIKALADSLAKAELGIKVSIYDVDFKAYETYESILKNACWYVYYDEYGYTVYEDPTGTIAVTFTGSSDSNHNDEGLTTFFIHKGTGETHEAVFTFDEEEVSMAAGQNKDLFMTIKMLPYDVTFSSSDTTGSITIDEKGSVTVKEGTAPGTTATITATMDVPGKDEPLTATCAITVEDVIYYTPKSAIDTIANLMKADGYNPTITYYDSDVEDSEFDNIVLNLGTSMTVEELEKLVVSKYTLEGFEALVEDDEDDDDDWDDLDEFDLFSNALSVDEETEAETTITWKDGTITIDGVDYDCKFIDYKLDNDYCYLMVEYFVYEIDGNLFLKVLSY